MLIRLLSRVLVGIQCAHKVTIMAVGVTLQCAHEVTIMGVSGYIVCS